MNPGVARFRTELADSTLIDLEPLPNAAQRSSDRELLDGIADADKLVMQRLIQEMFRRPPKSVIGKRLAVDPETAGGGDC